jgi:hypothetical protein
MLSTRYEVYGNVTIITAVVVVFVFVFCFPALYSKKARVKRGDFYW